MAYCTQDQTNAISSQANYSVWRSGVALNLSGTADATSVGNAESAISSMLRCLNNQETIPTSIQNAQSTLMEIESKYDAQLEDIRIAKERVEMMRNPNQHVSFYESWFPMDKPLRKGSLPVLIGLSILFFTLFLGFVLATMTITISFDFEFIRFPWVIAAINKIVQNLWILLLIAIIIIIWLARR
jgi:hypothetical protein